MAFYAENRSDVDETVQVLEANRSDNPRPPAEYPYSPGYFAVYFTDPDGLKFEFAYVHIRLGCELPHPLNESRQISELVGKVTRDAPDADVRA